MLQKWKFYCRSYKDSFADDLAKARYFCILGDRSTDSSVTEEELVYNLFLLCGKPTLKFLSIELAINANAEGIHSCIKEAFERVGVLDLSKKIYCFKCWWCCG